MDQHAAGSPFVSRNSIGWRFPGGKARSGWIGSSLALFLSTLVAAGAARAQEAGAAGAQPRGEADLIVPALNDPTVTFFGSLTGHTLLLFGLVISALGVVFGLVTYARLRNLPV